MATKGQGLFLGIDHTAIVVRNMKQSVSVYRDEVGMTVGGGSLNCGREQELLSRVPKARVKITSLRGARGMGIELLQYEEPRRQAGETVIPPVNSVDHWQIDIQVEKIRLAHYDRAKCSVPSSMPHDTSRGTIVHDLDGHTIWLETAQGGSGLLYARAALQQHWRRYLMEGAELGIFMAISLWFTLVLEHPRSLVYTAVSSPLVRRMIMGVAVGVTVVLLINSSWGMQSGAHFNPAVTLAFLRLKKIQPWDAFFYVAAQFVGGWLGLVLAALPFRRAARHEKVRYIATVPKPRGVALALAAEFVISFLLMATLLVVRQQPLLKSHTALFAGVLLFAYISFESPLSGMSLNPARSVASAIPAKDWKAIWIYFAAPISGMLLAAQLCQS